MKSVKLIKTENFRHQFVVYTDDPHHAMLVNEKGEVIQSNLSKMNIDTLQEVSILEIFQLIENKKKSQRMLDKVYALYMEDLKDEIEDLLDLQLFSQGQSSVCFEDAKRENSLLMYYAHFDQKNKLANVSMQMRHLEFLQKAKRKMVVLVVERFGVFYLDGQGLIDQVSLMKKSKHGGEIELKIDSARRITMPNETLLEHYSMDLNYFKDFKTPMEKKLAEVLSQHEAIIQVGKLVDKMKVKEKKEKKAKILPFKKVIPVKSKNMKNVRRKAA